MADQVDASGNISDLPQTLSSIASGNHASPSAVNPPPPITDSELAKSTAPSSPSATTLRSVHQHLCSTSPAQLGTTPASEVNAPGTPKSSPIATSSTWTPLVDEASSSTGPASQSSVGRSSYRSDEDEGLSQPMQLDNMSLSDSNSDFNGPAAMKESPHAPN